MVEHLLHTATQDEWKTNQRVHVHLPDICISQSCTFTSARWAEVCYFCFLLDCSFSVIAGASPLPVYWYDALWMHAGSFNLQAGFGILQKSRCCSLFVCLTSSINELMCVQLLVKLSLDCVYSEMEGSDTAVQTGNPVISSRCPRRPKKQVRCDVAWVPVSTPF